MLGLVHGCSPCRKPLLHPLLCRCGLLITWLCSRGKVAEQCAAMLSSAGGGAAQAAVAAALDGCANSSAALNAAFVELGQAEELQAPAYVTK